MATSSFDALGIPRLFNFDLPSIQNTHQALPEQADVSTISSVLDIASGSGEWAIATAQAYPHMQVVGIDSDIQMVDNARARAKVRGIDNVRFTVMAPFEPLDISGGSFDLVNVRFIVGLIPAEAWPKVLQEFLRVTRPGGHIRLTENDLPITSSTARRTSCSTSTTCASSSSGRPRTARAAPQSKRTATELSPCSFAPGTRSGPAPRS